MLKILPYLKAYVGLFGAIVTALLGVVPPDTQFWQILTYVAAILTAITIYVVPNKDPLNEHQDESVQPPDDSDFEYDGSGDEAFDLPTGTLHGGPDQRDHADFDPAIGRLSQPYGGEHEA